MKRIVGDLPFFGLPVLACEDALDTVGPQMQLTIRATADTIRHHWIGASTGLRATTST